MSKFVDSIRTALSNEKFDVHPIGTKVTLKSNMGVVRGTVTALNGKYHTVENSFGSLGENFTKDELEKL